MLSGLYMDTEGKKETKPVSFNLIKPEIFELYDVCQRDKVESANIEYQPADLGVAVTQSAVELHRASNVKQSAVHSDMVGNGKELQARQTKTASQVINVYTFLLVNTFSNWGTTFNFPALHYHKMIRASS